MERRHRGKAIEITEVTSGATTIELNSPNHSRPTPSASIHLRLKAKKITMKIRNASIISIWIRILAKNLRTSPILSIRPINNWRSWRHKSTTHQIFCFRTIVTPWISWEVRQIQHWWQWSDWRCKLPIRNQHSHKRYRREAIKIKTHILIMIIKNKIHAEEKVTRISFYKGSLTSSLPSRSAVRGNGLWTSIKM